MAAIADRSPESLLNAYRYLTMVNDGLAAVNAEPPHALRNARDRIAPMLRFFRHGDGGLALFQGGLESDPRMIAGLLARDEVRDSRSITPAIPVISGWRRGAPLCRTGLWQNLLPGRGLALLRPCRLPGV